MQIFFKVLVSALPLFGLVAIGYFAKRLRILHITDTDVLNRFVMDITLPAFIFDALVHNKLRMTFLSLPLVIWLSELAVFLLGLLIARICRLGPKQTGTVLLVSTFANTGYMGYPMTTAIFHAAMLPAAVIMDQIGMNTFMYPGAAMLGSVYGRSEGATFAQSFLRWLKSPLFGAMLVGLVARFIRWPAALTTGDAALVRQALAVLIAAGSAIIHVVAQATVPLIMISIGIILRPSSLSQHLGPVSIMAALKLLVAPLAGYAVARCLLHIGAGTALLGVCVLECALPPSANATLFSGQYEMDGSLGAAAFFALTTLSAITVPLALCLLR